MKEKYPIPEYCKKDCYFRDKKAKFMPACQFMGQVRINGTYENKIGEVDNRICKTYRKEEENVLAFM